MGRLQFPIQILAQYHPFVKYSQQHKIESIVKKKVTCYHPCDDNCNITQEEEDLWEHFCHMFPNEAIKTVVW